MCPAFNTPRLRPIILAGGVGARLAPISTDARPKPFIPLADGQSLLTHTLRRVTDSARFLPPILVGRARDRYALLNHARAAGITPGAILLEPQPRNTAMAIAVATAYIRAVTGPDMPEMLVFLPADHWLEAEDLWRHRLQQAAEAAQLSQKLCLLGVRPTEFNPNYGAMVAENPKSGQFWYEITKFIEKPDNNSAISGDYRWNSGQFIASFPIFSDLFVTHTPDLWQAAQTAIANAAPEHEFLCLPETSYAAAHSLPFDRAVVEHAPCVAIPLETHWRDLGTLADWIDFTGLTADYYRALPPRTDRPWGYFETILQTETRLEKRLTLYPGARISRQRHHHRDEYWEVLSGTATVEMDGHVATLAVGESITIGAGAWHRLSNATTSTLIILEKQMGKPDEADIERSDDDYGRI